MALAPRGMRREVSARPVQRSSEPVSRHHRHAAVSSPPRPRPPRRRRAGLAPMPRRVSRSNRVLPVIRPCPYNPATMAKREAPPEAETSMTVEELKTLLERARQQSKDNNGKVMMCSDRGPVGFDLVQHLITVVEQQQREIEDLKNKFIN
jgi:hypothetical protein